MQNADGADDGVGAGLTGLAGRYFPASPAALGQAAILATFAGTILLSATLLFSVQPMFARIVLPQLGGSPSVWAVSMCVFQALLLAGYCYAHVLNRWLEPVRANILHLALMGVAALALPIGLPAGISEPPSDGAYGWLIGILLAGVGLPFFAISANAPLLQAWFAKTGHRHAENPYFLYAASNCGSLLALLAYPLVIEPQLGLSFQTGVWGGAFVVLAAMIAGSGLMLRFSRSGVPVSAEAAGSAGRAMARPVTHADRALWVALAFLPSGMMVAVTTYVATDIASAPFLWVIPLALFLLTFVVMFQDRPPLSYNVLCGVLPLAVPMALATHMMSSITGALAIGLPYLAFFIAALVCHREMYVRRPTPDRLTEFYLLMSLGGVLGGVFSALIAPQLFISVFEFPLLLILSLLVLPGVMLGRPDALSWRRIALILAFGIALETALHAVTVLGLSPSGRATLAIRLCVLVGALYFVRKWPEFRFAVVLSILIGVFYTSNDLDTIHSERGFFGTHRVILSRDGNLRLLAHGTTVHGQQRLRENDGRPVVAAKPATYYYAGGPMARGVGIARASTAKAGTPFAVGVVGLGTGSIGCYAKPGENWRFFEIDPLVVKIARNPKYFDFLSRCQPAADIVIGDARLTVGKEPLGRFGYLVIDAFSSDAIPVHLLTAEAIKAFADRIDDNGLMAIHVSNRHLDLVPSLASSIALVPGLVGVEVLDAAPRDPDASPSHVVFVAKNAAVLAPVLGWPGVRPLVAGSVPAWTDDFSNVLSAMLRKHGG